MAKTPADPYPQWSCDERNRSACRNPFGCHCREIEDLNETVRGKEALVKETLRLLRRVEASTVTE